MASIVQKPILEQVDPPRSPRETLPTMYDLPSENPEEPGLPDEFHDLQPQLLSRTLQLSHYTRDNYFTASDLNLYYDVNHPLWYKRPDWFLAIDVPRLYDGADLRRSYVIWQEGKSPYVAIELLSPGTAREDLGRFYDETAEVVNPKSATSAPDSVENGSEQRDTKPPAKLDVYERFLRIPHYLVYNRYTRQLRHFKLDGGQYQEQALDPENPIAWLADLGIGLGIWQGEFEDVSGYWLRWCMPQRGSASDCEPTWLLTDTEQERRSNEQSQAQLLQSQAQLLQSQAQLLQAARNLLTTGMEMEQVIQILGLSDTQVQMLQSSNQQEDA